MAINEMMQQHSMRDGADDDDDAASCSAPMLVSQQQRSMANLKERTYLSIYESGIASCRHTPYRAHHLTYRPSSNIKPSLDISFYLSIYLSWAPSLLLAVKIRMASVDSIKKITASMKLVAAARMKAADDRMNRIRPFAASTELTAGASPSLSLSRSLTPSLALTRGSIGGISSLYVAGCGCVCAWFHHSAVSRVDRQV